jgi:hypothetical protein
MASASKSLADGGLGVPSALPPGPWYAPFPHVYGPLFFNLSAAFISVFGLSAETVRVVCVLGAALLVAATAWLMRSAGLGPRWAAIGCALMTLTPELGTIATNGRMDTLAIAMEIAAMAAFVQALRSEDRGAGVRWGAAAGGLWLLALLTQVRALPLLAGMGLGGVCLLIGRANRQQAFAAGAAAVTVFLVGGWWWTHHLGLTPIEWALTYLRSSRGDAQNLALAGRPRVWGLELRNAMTPLVILAAGAGSVVMLWWRAPATEPPSQSTSEPASRLLPLAAVLIASIVNVAFIFAVANNVFTSSSYFVLPLLASILIVSVAIAQRAGRPDAIAAFWIAVVLVFGAARTMKYVEVWQTWPYRDPAPLHQFVARHVPPGSLVFGYDQYYYYAVQAAGSTFRTWTPTPFPPPAFGRPEGISVEGEPSAAMADRRYFVWPVNGLPGAVPPSFACVVPHEVARFSESDTTATGVEHFGGFIASLHGYPDTVLYRLPPDCHP